MNARKAFATVLKIVFILFCIQFTLDTFFYWDGFSYYMRFMDLLPDLSLAFILWTILGSIISLITWFVLYGLFKVIPKSIIPVRLEHITIWLCIMVLLRIIKIVFIKNISLSNLTSINNFMIVVIAAVLSAIIVWFIRKHYEKILSEINSRLTLLVCFFAFLVVLALPLSFYKTKPAEEKYTPDNSSVSNDREQGPMTTDKKLPNIILILMDALTARDMQVHGYNRPTTPFISKWANDAIVFDKAYASSNWTTPAAMSLMTGQRVWTHRIWYYAKFNPVSNYEKNFPRVLKDHGYDVYSFVANYNAHPETLGIKDAFSVKDKAYTFWKPSEWWFDKLSDKFVTRRIVKDWIFEKNPIAEQINSYQSEIYTTLKPSESVYNSFLEYIDQTKLKKSNTISKHQDESDQRPFFAWIHVWPPHDFYLPPAPYMGLFGDAERFNTLKKQKNSELFYKEYEHERQPEVDILRKRYDEFIIYSDKQFELFLTQLAEIIDMTNTIIILSSDHGESFSHGFQGHFGSHLYESLVHIPLIIKMPGKEKGKVVDTPVEQTDIAPTILELAGISAPKSMEGRSLLPLLEGANLQPRPVYSMQFLKNRSLRHKITRGTIAVWDGDYKLIYYLDNKKTLLFNVETDPGETKNISLKKPDITQHLKGLIEHNLSLANKRITQITEK